MTYNNWATADWGGVLILFISTAVGVDMRTVGLLEIWVLGTKRTRSGPPTSTVVWMEVPLRASGHGHFSSGQTHNPNQGGTESSLSQFGEETMLRSPMPW